VALSKVNVRLKGQLILKIGETFQMKDFFQFLLFSGEKNFFSGI
jgi:hypothetical protein